MWRVSTNSRRSTLSHAQLESLVLERTMTLQNLSQQLLKVQDEERRRVARDLHDSTGQTLTALKMSLADLEKRLQQNQCTTGVLCDIAALADQALQEIRTTSYLLHPPLLDEAGFTAAAQWYAEGFAKRSGIEARLDFGPELQRFPPHIETALFRVLQESLTNVHRYSGSPQVKIRLQRQAGTVTLEIEDFGRGIPGDLLTRLRQASAETGVGLAGMRERMNDLKGMLEIESNTHGTIIRAVVPLPQSLDLLGANCETSFLVRTRRRVAGNFERKRSALGAENARRWRGQPIHRLAITWDMAVNRVRVWRRAPLVAAGVPESSLAVKTRDAKCA